MNSSLPLLTISNSCSQPPPVFTQKHPKELRPHPWNSNIYGENEDVTELISLIRASRWVERLVITPTDTIISGHRRCQAALALGWESVPVEVREFPDETAELEALLIANATRIKTTEQRVREAEAWEIIEKAKAKQRQQQAAAITNQKIGRDSSETLMENFPQAFKGTTRDAVASRVGLGSGRTYSKAVKVVRAIDSLLEDTPETAQALRKVLNERSVDAATKLLKQISISGNASEAFWDRGSPTRGNSSNGTTAEPLSSCWNCQHRGELIANHSFYCNRLGIMSLIDKNADLRGTECELWSYQQTNTTDTNFPQPTQSTFTLVLPAHLQPLIQDAARTTGMSVVDWAAWVLESEALATCSTNTSTDSLDDSETDNTSHQVAQYREADVLK